MVLLPSVPPPQPPAQALEQAAFNKSLGQIPHRLLLGGDRPGVVKGHQENSAESRAEMFVYKQREGNMGHS